MNDLSGSFMALLLKPYVCSSDFFLLSTTLNCSIYVSQHYLEKNECTGGFAEILSLQKLGSANCKFSDRIKRLAPQNINPHIATFVKRVR